MEDNLDDMLNEFFNKKNKKIEDPTILDIVESLLKNKEDQIKYEQIVGKIDELGEPDEIEEYVDGDYNLEKKTWYTDLGETIIMTTIREKDEDPLAMETQKLIDLLKEADVVDLKDLMDAALDDEDYESCQLIKNEIDGRKKIKIKKT